MPGRRQIERRRRSQPAGADDRCMRRFQPLLAGAAHLPQHQVPRIAFDLFVGEAHP
jgi:hypothetical protein